MCYSRKQWNQKKRWRGCSHVVKSLFFLTGCGGKWASCLRWGVICWMETFVSQLGCSFRCHHSGQVSSSVTALPSRPSPFLVPCSCPASVLTRLRWVLGSAQGRGTWPCGCKWVGKGRALILAQRAQLFILTAPFLHRLELSKSPFDFIMLLFLFLCWGPPTTFHKLPSMSSKNARTLQISGQSPLLFWKVNNARFKHPGGFWCFTAPDFRDS